MMYLLATAYRSLLTHRGPRLALAGLTALVIGCSISEAADPAYVIRHVNVIDVIKGSIESDRAVFIRGGRIAAIVADNKSLGQPADSNVIDGKGKYLSPGFIDMHVHLNTLMKASAIAPTLSLTEEDILSPAHLSLFLYNGVTSIQVMHGDRGMLVLRDAIRDGKALGPRMVVTTPRLDGNPPSDPYVRIVATGPEGRDVVDEMHATGYDLIKIYDLLSRDSYDAIISEAHRLGMRVDGHLPRTLPLEYGLGLDPPHDHQDRVAHMEDFASYAKTGSDEEVAMFTALAKKSGVAVTPTLIVFHNALRSVFGLDKLLKEPATAYADSIVYRSWLPDRNEYQSERFQDPDLRNRLLKRYDFMKRLTLAFFKAGVPMDTGTDCYVSGTVCGFSFTDELEELVGAGISPAAVMKLATLDGARAIEMEKDLGTVDTGKIADLVLLDANPLMDVANTHKIVGIFVHGRWLSKDVLRQHLEDALTQFSKLDKRMKLHIKRPNLISH